MEFVVKRLSRMQGQCVFRSWTGWTTGFGRIPKNSQVGEKCLREGCPRPDLTPLEVRGGTLTSPPHNCLGASVNLPAHAKWME